MGFLASPSSATMASRQQQAIRPPDAIGDVRQPGGGGGFWGKIGGFLKKASPYLLTAGSFLIPGAGPIMSGIRAGIGAAGGALAARGAQQSAMQRSPEELQALTGAQGAASSIQQGGQSLIQAGQGAVQQGMDTLAQPTNYWSRLLGGNRALMAQATAGARGGITDIYRGAERGLERSGVRGAQRDLAKAELGRERAGKIAGLTTGVQPFAAQQLGDLGSAMAGIGTQTTGAGAGLMGQSGNIYANLLGQGFANRQYGRQEGEHAGTGMGGFLFDLLSGFAGGGKGKIPTIPSRAFGGMSTWTPPKF